MPFYAGIGSRSTPQPIELLMHLVAQRLAEQNWTVRSGHADGADLAFEYGAASARPAMERTVAHIYLPWASFNEQHSPRVGCFYIRRPHGWTFGVAERLHPAWERLGRGPRALMARNVHQVLGDAEDSERSSFVVCWTPDGATTEVECSRSTGGTGLAIRLASRYSIPVFNLARPEHRARLCTGLDLPSPNVLGDVPSQGGIGAAPAKALARTAEQLGIALD